MNQFKLVIVALLLSLAVVQTGLADEARIDVNTATVEELAETLHGVGMAKAQAIVEHRETNGPFEHIDELIEVQGIGLRTVDNNRERIELPGASTGE
ncbi:ComEA family DNA-binding protein [Wenzhouxiangella sp. AB-CW3]|uniref:ComEA family DNA-binding protein n=1 Tax=Wenzhouxiangella sp. AB-CW3 TaxID=2771012 RepID=UPI00168A751E|nr:ComEA family DNA-binding protein [Wenzhouxiangella sp. AB-CW3]QOC23847.1 ComEA family DNA-binding protein [Wenzhouxiangella sp. AB-CW3]